MEREELPAHMTRVSVPEIRMVSDRFDRQKMRICSSLEIGILSQAQKAERDASDLKGTMRKRMEFLDMD